MHKDPLNNDDDSTVEITVEITEIPTEGFYSDISKLFRLIINAAIFLGAIAFLIFLFVGCTS
jgi:hypothetical protein